jgi:hypothetical protein
MTTASRRVRAGSGSTSFVVPSGGLESVRKVTPWILAVLVVLVSSLCAYLIATGPWWYLAAALLFLAVFFIRVYQLSRPPTLEVKK